jgi:cyclase
VSKQYPRRTLLQATAVGVAALALPQLGRAADAGIRQLEGPLGLITETGPNVLVLTTSKGLVLVDSGAQPGGAQLMERVQALAPNGDYTLFNTHWHDEQTGGNEALGKAGARIISHEKTRLRLSTDYWLPEQDRYQKALPIAAQPNESFYTAATLSVDSETIDYGYLQQAHTDGDIYVFFRNANVLAAGDVVSPARDPEHDWFGGGWIGGRLEALDLLLQLANDSTRIVPAFGPVISKAQLQAERDLIAFLYDKLVDQIRMGFTPQDSLDSGVMGSLPRQFSDPYKFLYDAHKGLWAHHNKLAPNIV